MPTYVYECSSCKKTFEIEQRITEDALDTCLCGSKGTVKRLIQPIAVMFKGSGFYINDSASKPVESAPTETKAVETKTEEAKPAETTTTPAAS